MSEGVDLEERNLFKDSLSEREITDLAQRAGGIEALVAPTRRNEVEGMSKLEIQHYLLEDPGRLRRPIIDTGDTLYLGFTKSVQEALAR